jgi:replication fork clamp-binding protein CrfC
LFVDEYCTFADEDDVIKSKRQRFKDFDKLRTEIELRTSKRAGTNKNISNIPIIVKVFSPKVINLTVVDLPGVVKVVCFNLKTLNFTLSGD